MVIQFIRRYWAIFVLAVLLVAVFVTAVLSDSSLNSKNSRLHSQVTELQQKNSELSKKITALESDTAAVKEKLKQMEEVQILRDSKPFESEPEGAGDRIAAGSNSDSGETYTPSDGKEKIAYLTFDDGPSVNTDRILDILKSNDIKATFFVNGNENMLDSYRKIIQEGHVIGNHTYSHDYKKLYSSVYDFISDFGKLNDLLAKIDGYKTDIFRFPGGSTNGEAKRYGGSKIMSRIKDAMSEKGYTYFDWNVSSADSDPGPMGKDKDVLVKNVLNGAKGRHSAIVLMHDRADRNATVEALPEIIDGLKKQGFEFKSLTKDVKQP